MTFRRSLLAAFSTAVLLGLAWGCSTADNSGTRSPTGAGGNGVVEPGDDASVMIMPDGSAQDAGQLGLNPLCGVGTACVPDLPMSCGDFTPSVMPSEDASVGADAAPSQMDASSEGGSGGDSAGPIDSSGAGGQGGASGAAGEAGSAGVVGASGAPPVTAPKYGCQVQRAESPASGAFFSCALAGLGGESAPCLTASDCQAGLGCVGDQNAGLCLRYCCQDADDCESGTYCAARPMRDRTTNASGGASETLMIPVCAHAENCDLSSPYPCPNGSECACKSGTACLVVRSDGTTTCAVPGKGKAGDACPCAWGHVCSAATRQCLKLCYTRDSGTCGEGKCQAASELPDGWGVCVGG
ncbi:MAG TPA: hypothetical protein VGJ91_02785 [Polyangiaceae bacterium]|jgi:hypothetical protein